MATRILGIAAELSAPPSSPTSFREISMFGRVNRGYTVIAYCDHDWIDSYARWFRQYGLFDYVADILTRDQAGELSIEIEGGPGARLTAFNVREVMAWL